MIFLLLEKIRSKHWKSKLVIKSEKLIDKNDALSSHQNLYIGKQSGKKHFRDNKVWLKIIFVLLKKLRQQKLRQQKLRQQKLRQQKLRQQKIKKTKKN